MAQQIVSTEIKTTRSDQYAVAVVRSDSGHEYRVDVTNKRCSCPAWKFSRKNAEGARPLCKHLKSLGYSEN
jgi:predicted nucleic acid-binding Zn finger protein